jgi:ribosomal-protein-serine acetyltransferase
VLRHQLPGGCALRLLEESDAAELFALVDANRAHLGPWMPWLTPYRGQEQALEFIRSTRRQLAENRGYQTAIVAGERIVGIVGFHGVDWANRSTSIGYWLAADQEGRGTMTKAVRALVDHAFDGWALARVEIRAAVENARSRAVAERLGFREEGTLRRAERVGDRWLDHVIYAMLAEDWAAKR